MSSEQPDRRGGAGRASGPSAQQRADAVRVRRRSAPRYRVFIGIGIVVGAVAAVVLTSLFARDGEFGTGSVLGYTVVLLGLVGGLLGGGVAVLLDRRR